MSASHKAMVGLLQVLEVLFFTGLAGCTLVVFISWVTILKSALSKHGDGVHDAMSDIHHKP